MALQNTTPDSHWLLRNIKGTWLWPAYALFFVMVVVPVTAKVLMGVLVGTVLYLVALRLTLKGAGLRIHPALWGWTLWYLILGVFFIALGLSYGAPGAMFSSVVYVLSPVVYLLLLGAATAVNIWVRLLQLIVVGTIAIGGVTVEYLLWKVGKIPDALHVDIGMIKGVGFLDGSVGMSHESIAPVVFAVPFLMACLVVYGRDCGTSIASRKLLWCALIMGFAVTLLAGRKALILVVVFAPFLIAFLVRQLPHSSRTHGQRDSLRRLLWIGVAILIATFALGSVVDLSWQGLVQLVASGFDRQAKDPGASVRLDQMSALFRGWELRPLFGNGLGSFTHEVIRSDDRPWAYELQYSLMLFQTGIVGVVLYGAGIVWLYWMGLKVIRSRSEIGVHMVPVLVGTTCFLIANSVEPYLQTFGQLWPLFLPLGLINWWLLTNGAPRAGIIPSGPPSHPSPGLNLANRQC
jgi:hypothetical protein